MLKNFPLGVAYHQPLNQSLVISLHNLNLIIFIAEKALLTNAVYTGITKPTHLVCRPMEKPNVSRFPPSLEPNFEDPQKKKNAACLLTLKNVCLKLVSNDCTIIII